MREDRLTEIEQLRSRSLDAPQLASYFILEELTTSGCRRLALFGSRKTNERIRDAGILGGFDEIVIIESDRRSEEFLGFPVLLPGEAEAWGLEAILITSEAYDREIWERCEPFRDRGVECRRLYGANSLMRRTGELLYKRFGSEKNSDRYWERRLLAEVDQSDKIDPRSERRLLLIHHNYYHFYYLAEALRKRGWWAFSASVESPEGPFAKYYHGEDLCLFSEDQIEMCLEMYLFYEYVKRSFKMVQFSGHWRMAFFPDEFGKAMGPRNSFLELKASGIKIGYTINGCTSGVSQTSVRNWSIRGKAVPVCDVCVWRDQPTVCCDELNLAWGKVLDDHSDLIAAETSPALDYLDGTKTVFEPLTMSSPSAHLRLDAEIPQSFIQPREPSELLIFHSMGNYETRNVGALNVKGTPYVIEAVERLREEGHRVRLMFFTEVPSEQIIHYQRQADIVVDQLHFGRWGATAREAMMLGKPVVGYFATHELNPRRETPFLREVPIVNAHEGTVLDVLRKLIVEPEYRKECGERSRRFALKWFSPDSCAERFEQVYDRVVSGEDPS